MLLAASNELGSELLIDVFVSGCRSHRLFLRAQQHHCLHQSG